MLDVNKCKLMFQLQPLHTLIYQGQSITFMRSRRTNIVLCKI